MSNRAIVVGIQEYPELRPELNGARGDAQRFFDWVTTAGGVDGDEKKGHAKLFLSPSPRPGRALDGTPTEALIRAEFDALETEAAESPTGKAGERLYLYLSGHGFGKSIHDSALLMANATQLLTRNNVGGRAWADHFYASGYFDEVLLFMDCCRERSNATATPNGPGPGFRTPPTSSRCFYALAAQHGKLAVEREIEGVVTGVFTATLMDALSGWAADSNGNVTGDSLLAYLYSSMKQLLTPADLADKDVAQEPDLHCEPQATARSFVIVNVPQKKHKAPLDVSLKPVGTALTLMGERDGDLYAELFADISDATGVWDLDLAVGKYLLLIGDLRRTVTVTGRGGVHVA